MASSNDLLICNMCGTQFDETNPEALTNCRICDDPRQYVPASGQSFTTMSAIKAKYSNEYAPIPLAPHLTSITTIPKFGIGQRAILIRTPGGNVLWDCITLLDAETISWINSRGGLAAIVISHPHFYSAHNLWAETFKCPVYVSREDEEWLNREDKTGARKFIERGNTEVVITGKEGKDIGVKAIKLGGHFPGSLVLLYEKSLLIADTLMTTPAGVGNWKEKGRPTGMNSFAFMWSIPNIFGRDTRDVSELFRTLTESQFIPLGPEDVARMWSVLKKYDFSSTHGAFAGMDIVSEEVKGRVLESMKIQIRQEGYGDHKLLYEEFEGP